MQLLEWLKKVKDPDTDEFYRQRDKDGNIIKGTGSTDVQTQREGNRYCPNCYD